MKGKAVIILQIIYCCAHGTLGQNLPDIPERFSANIQVNVELTDRDFKAGKTIAFSESVVNPNKARLEYQIGNFWYCKEIALLQSFL